jgi:putative effector of murein hydrolase
MASPAPARPAAVIVIGVFSLVLAACFLLSTLAWLLGIVVLQERSLLLRALSFPANARVAGMWVAHPRAAAPRALLQAVVGAALLAASLRFLGLRESGRKALEALNWFGLVWAAVNRHATVTRLPGSSAPRTDPTL